MDFLSKVCLFDMLLQLFKRHKITNMPGTYDKGEKFLRTSRHYRSCDKDSILQGIFLEVPIKNKYSIIYTCHLL